jgi:hypothetical protein
MHRSCQKTRRLVKAQDATEKISLSETRDTTENIWLGET